MRHIRAEASSDCESQRGRLQSLPRDGCLYCGNWNAGAGMGYETLGPVEIETGTKILTATAVEIVTSTRTWNAFVVSDGG